MYHIGYYSGKQTITNNERMDKVESDQILVFTSEHLFIITYAMDSIPVSGQKGASVTSFGHSCLIANSRS
jgi:hypothetical protein